MDIGTPEGDMSFHSSASRLAFKGYQAVYGVSSINIIIVHLLFASSMDFRNPLWCSYLCSPSFMRPCFLQLYLNSLKNVLVGSYSGLTTLACAFGPYELPHDIFGLLNVSTIKYYGLRANCFSGIAFNIHAAFYLLST